MDVYADFIFYKSGVYTVSLYMLQPIWKFSRLEVNYLQNVELNFF
jgi:hypothetical protein